MGVDHGNFTDAEDPDTRVGMALCMFYKNLGPCPPQATGPWAAWFVVANTYMSIWVWIGVQVRLR